jgi:hypothetical protein
MLTKDRGVFAVLTLGHIAPYKNTPKCNPPSEPSNGLHRAGFH